MTHESSVTVYPARPAVFAMKFIRKLTKTCAAQEIGPSGFAILTVVATTEDAAGYCRAVTFFDGQLAPLIGVESQKSLAIARRKCTEAGWLHYEPGGKGRAARYWVLIPGYAEQLDDMATDEGERDARHLPRKIDDESGRNREGIGDDATGQRSNILPIPIPIPNTEGAPDGACDSGQAIEQKAKQSKKAFDPSSIPIPTVLDTPDFREAIPNWFQHRRDIRHPMTETSLRSLYRKLSKYGPAAAVEMLETAMANGWRGVVFDGTNDMPHANQKCGHAQPIIKSTEEELAARRKATGGRRT